MNTITTDEFAMLDGARRALAYDEKNNYLGTVEINPVYLDAECKRLDYYDVTARTYGDGHWYPCEGKGTIEDFLYRFEVAYLLPIETAE